MILDGNGQPMPPMGSGTHWAMLVALQAVPALYDPLRDRVATGLDLRIANGDRVIDSQHVGSEVLKDLPSSWFGNFHRQFQAFPNGAEGGISGMEVYRQLATRQSDDWRPMTKPDPRGVWDTMLYERV